MTCSRRSRTLSLKHVINKHLRHNKNMTKFPYFNNKESVMNTVIKIKRRRLILMRHVLSHRTTKRRSQWSSTILMIHLLSIRNANTFLDLLMLNMMTMTMDLRIINKNLVRRFLNMFLLLELHVMRR